MARLRIYVPCAVLPVRIRIGYGSGGLSPMETSLLRVVIGLSLQGGDPDAAPEPVPLRDILRVVGLGRTMTMHLIADLWRQGHLVLDMRDELVTPDADTLAAHREGEFNRLVTGETALDVVEVLQESVTGQVIGAVGLTRPPDPRLTLPRSTLFQPSQDEISPSALLAAAERVVEQSGTDLTDDKPSAAMGQGRRPAIREAHLDRSSIALPLTRWVPLEVSVRHDTDSDRLRIDIADRTLDAVNRAVGGTRISQFLEENPDHKFVQHLAGQASTVLTAPATPERLLERLSRLLAGARTAAAGTRQSQHDRLTDLVDQIRRQLDDQRSAEMDVRVVGDGRSHTAEVRALVDSAERQLVVASPIVMHEIVQELLDPLRDMLTRGAQLVVLWGSQRQKKLDERVVRILTSLRKTPAQDGRGSAVLWSARPARSAACFIVADGDRALVGGCPPLAKPRRGELALAIRAPHPRDCRPIQQLLTWSRRAMPDHAVSQGILFRPSDLLLRPSDPATSADPAQQVPPEHLQIDPYPDAPPDHNEPEAATAVVAWAAAWARIVEQIRAIADRPGPPAVGVVEDGAHRDLFWDSLRDAKTRIAIGADEVAGKVVDGRLLNVLRRRLDAGVSMRVVHRRGVPDGHGRDGHALLRQLAEGRPPGSCLIQRAQSNGRAVVSDDTTLVGSFDLLAHEGYFSTTGRRSDSELGLVVTDRTVADAVADALGAVAVDDGAPEPAPLPVTDVAVPGHRGAGAAQRLLTELSELRGDEPKRAALVRRAVEDAGLDVLTALESAGASDDVLRVAAAWWLLGNSGRDNPEAAHWTAWLLCERWRNGDIAGTWVLRRAVDARGDAAHVDVAGADGAQPPGEQVIRLAAALGSTRLDEVVMNIVMAEEPPSPPLLAALVLVGTAELTTGSANPRQTTTLLDVMVYLADVQEIAPPLSDLARVLAAAEPPAFPFPIEDLYASRDRQRQRDQIDADWRTVADALTAAGGTSFVFDAGIKTHAHLFHTAGLFGALDDIIERRDLTALRAWVRSGELRDLGNLVDRVSDEVTQNHSRIEGRPRRGYVMKLTSVVTAARRLARRPDPPDDDIAIHQRAATSLPLATAMSRLWPAVPVAVAAMVSPERDICDRMLIRLTPVVEWGRGADV